MTWHSQEITVGTLQLGGANPVRLQSMTNTDTLDTKASVEQAIRIIEAGGEMVRFTTQGIKQVDNLKNIKKELRRAGMVTPIIADVHFNPEVAVYAAGVADKVRINPGNYADKRASFSKVEYTDKEYAEEIERIHERLMPLIKKCNEFETAIRIGVNHGSLSDRIMTRYGNTPQGMAESAMEFIRIFEAEDFSNLVLSMKSSSSLVMVESTELLVRMMQDGGHKYPLHLGVTEAGEGEDGRIRSALGIGKLLIKGIGDTIRVSLSEAPEAELPVAKKIVEYASQYREAVGENEPDRSYSGNTKTYWLNYSIDDIEELTIRAAVDSSQVMIPRSVDDLHIRNRGSIGAEKLESVRDGILQAARIKITRNDYISCPTCGRTKFNLEEAVTRVKKATSQLKGLKIAIMGCIVNGPGEMADADYGYIGSGPGKVSLYKGQTEVYKNVPEEEAVEKLLGLIEEDLKG
jgi:(E)-4-hydroxy-3-methylbut-2-enyl-diphosphate synthase